MSRGKWSPLVSSLKRTGDGTYEVRGITTGHLLGHVWRRSTWRRQFNWGADWVDGEGKRHGAGHFHDTRAAAWAEVERRAIADALVPTDEADA